MNTDLSEEIFDIAVETFENMCYMFPLDQSEVGDREIPDKSDMTAAVVAFDGAAEGGMVLYACPGLVEAIAENMLGGEDATLEQKYGAVCEIANIICGNIVPFFTRNDHICYIRPPRIAGSDEQIDKLFGDRTNREATRVHLDEGVADIVVFYS